MGDLIFAASGTPGISLEALRAGPPVEVARARAADVVQEAGQSAASFLNAFQDAAVLATLTEAATLSVPLRTDTPPLTLDNRAFAVRAPHTHTRTRLAGCHLEIDYD